MLDMSEHVIHALIIYEESVQNMTTGRNIPPDQPSPSVSPSPERQQLNLDDLSVTPLLAAEEEE